MSAAIHDDELTALRFINWWTVGTALFWILHFLVLKFTSW